MVASTGLFASNALAAKIAIKQPVIASTLSQDRQVADTVRQLGFAVSSVKSLGNGNWEVHISGFDAERAQGAFRGAIIAPANNALGLGRVAAGRDQRISGRGGALGPRGGGAQIDNSGDGGASAGGSNSGGAESASGGSGFNAGGILGCGSSGSNDGGGSTGGSNEGGGASTGAGSSGDSGGELGNLLGGGDPTEGDGGGDPETATGPRSRNTALQVSITADGGVVINAASLRRAGFRNAVNTTVNGQVNFR